MSETPVPSASARILWAAIRVFWQSLLALFFGVIPWWGAGWALSSGDLASAVVPFLFGAAILTAVGYAFRYTWRVMTGAETLTASQMRSETGIAVLLLGSFGLLAAIVFPLFSQLPRRSAEGAMKGRLKALRDGVVLYRAQAGGGSPAEFETLARSVKYKEPLELWPRFAGIPHPRTREGAVVSSSAPADTGRWAYFRDAETAQVFIDCTHTDTRGTAWNAY